jgi:hypothetical protein
MSTGRHLRLPSRQHLSGSQIIGLVTDRRSGGSYIVRTAVFHEGFSHSYHSVADKERITG